jgi:hypothetical protein
MVIRKTTRTRRGGEPDLERIVLDGRVFAFDALGRPAPMPSMDELRATWDEIRGDVLPEFISSHPGTRPWAWYRWDCSTPPAFTWPLNHMGSAGIPFCTNRKRPAMYQQLQYLRPNGLMEYSEIESLPDLTPAAYNYRTLFTDEESR